MSVVDRGKSRLSIILDHYKFKSYVNTIGREELLKGAGEPGRNFVVNQERFGEIADTLFSVSNSPIYTKDFVSDDKFGNINSLGDSLQITFEQTNNSINAFPIRVFLDIGDPKNNLENLEKNSFSEEIRALYKSESRNEAIKLKIQGSGANDGRTVINKPFSIKKMLGLENSSVINNNPDENPKKSSPHLASYQIFDESLAIGNRQTLELASFFNLIPTIELSRAVPIVSAKFSLPKTISRNTGSRRDEFSVANNADFLFGSSPDSAKASMDAYRGDSFIKTIESQRSGNTAEKLGINSNLDIFLSPQTLVNANEEYIGLDTEFSTADKSRSGRANPVIDKMRPFMTIESFDIDVKPTRGLLSYKTGQLNLVLHDRSRMIDIAPFIKPDLFGAFGSEISIEYGWAHPDGSNPYGAMLNLLRATEKYMIVNSSFSLQQTGEVKISLSLAMLGATDIVNRNVFSNEEVQRALGSFNQELTLFRQQVIDQENSGNNSDITSSDSASISQARTVINSANEGNKLLELLNKFIREGNGDEIGSLLERQARRLKSELEKVGEAKSAIFKDVEDIIEKPYDPYLSYEVLSKLKIVNENGDVIDTGGEQTTTRSVSDYISFGKLIMGTIGKDLTLTGRFNEVQVIFYNTNNKCGSASSINIANLPIRKSILKTYLTNVINREISAMSLGNLILALSKRFIENKASLIYGFEGIFEYNPETGGTKTGRNISVSDAIASQKELLYEVYYGAEQLNILKSALRPGSNELSPEQRRALLRKVDFLEVKIGFSTEVVYKGSAKKLNKLNVSPEPEFSFKSSSVEDDTILRIHIFDKSNTPFQGAYDFLSDVIKNDIDNINQNLNVNRPDLIGQSSRAKKIAFNAALQENLNFLREERNEEEGFFKISTKFGAIKETYKKIMPSLTYGSQNSAIINATFQTINEGRLPTVFITRAERELDTNSDDQANAIKVGADHLPTRVLPTKVDLTTFGCPIINFAQSLFLDFGTGTTIDNLYNVTGIKHTIAQGKFESGITLQYGDVYGKFETRKITETKLNDILEQIQKNITSAARAREAGRRARRASRRSRSYQDQGPGQADFILVNLFEL